MKRTGFSRVVVENFQSIASADVPLGPLTIIVGDNDAGKSALLRAIRAACFNETGTGNIRRGESKMLVQLDLFDGIDLSGSVVRWRKKREGGATYDLSHDGGLNYEHFSKLGAAVPPEVARALNIAEIEVDKTLTILPQVHQQGEFAFLIDRSEGQAARALAKMTKLDVVVEAQGLIRGDLKRVRADAKATADLVADLERQEKEFDGLDAEVKMLENVSDFIGLAESEQRRIASMRAGLTKYIEARQTCEDIGDLPDEKAVAALTKDFNWLLAARRAERAYDDAAAVDIGDLPDIYPAVQALTRIVLGRNSLREYEQAVVAVTDAHEEMRENDERYMALVMEWNALDVCSACGQPLEKMVPA